MGDGLMDYFTADLHFNHKNIITYCKRGAFRDLPEFRNGTERLFRDVEEMNEHIIRRWNDTVRDEDTCFLLGDVAFGPKLDALSLCQRLNGNKVLIYGNHDLRCSFDFWRAAGFSDIHRLGYGMTLPYKEFLLSHYPYRKALSSYDHRDYLFDHAAEETKTVLLHGHVHDRWQVRDNMVNVGIDVWNYRPVSIDTIRDTVTELGLPK
jgi:calcineurin-like phosphoesterase family protein